MDDLIAEFIAETRDMLDALGGEIVAWEADPTDRARLDEIFRFVHTVKGNCGFFDLPRIRALSHAAEDVLTDLRSGKRSADHQLVSAVLAIIDRLGELVQELENGENLVTDDDAQLIAALSQSGGKKAAEPTGIVAAAGGRSVTRSIRLPVDLLDRMMSGISDLVLARNELGRSLRESACGANVESAFDRVSGTISEMRDVITHTRMQRIDNLFAALPRLVRDLSDELGKHVMLEIEGGDVELDREMIELIRDPLTHIIRNAIDHGIEGEAERQKAGKSAAGLLRVSACQAGNQILIEISDNGRGIDGDKLVAKAVAIGLITSAQADRLSPTQRSALIFQPGLSTAGEVTAISGRGVGMDVVRANIERIGGLIDIDNRPGEGLHLTLRVPLTLTIIPALTVQIAGQSYAIPRATIEEIVRVKGGTVRIDTLGGSVVATIRGKRLPLVSLGDALGIPHDEEISDQSLIVLKPAGGGLYALAVDRICDHEELVVKPAAPAVMATGLYAGTTLADDGRPILLLDPLGIAARSGVALEAKAITDVFEPAAPTLETDAVPALLFRAVCGAKRIVPIAAVERIEDVALEAIRLSAGRLHVALGESILPLQGCGEEMPERGVRILKLSDGVSQIAYGFAEVVDIVSLGNDIRPAAVAGEVRGVTLIDGDQVEVLDLFRLFEASGIAAPLRRDQKVCALPAGDSWMETILRPIIESAGYRVVRTGEAGAEKADVHIVNADDLPEVRPAAASGQILKIRSDIGNGTDQGDSIHRYDHAALLQALAAGGGKRKKA